MDKRKVIAQIIKNWAASHHAGYSISVGDEDDVSVSLTGSYFTWVIQNCPDTVIDLVQLLNSIDNFIKSTETSRQSGGSVCLKCKTFINMAEPNQPNGTFICYSCRQNPFI
jgi:hypothetical protein